jgi:hypothetical protein
MLAGEVLYYWSYATSPIFFFFVLVILLVVLGFELRDLHLLGRHFLGLF